MKDKKYTQAIALFQSISKYKEAGENIKECKYLLAESQIKGGDYESALKELKEIDGYKDASDLYSTTAYNHAVKLAEEKDYKNAISFFEKIKGYKDADKRKTDSQYLYGCQLLAQEKAKDAIQQFGKCKDYKDSADKILEAEYLYVSRNKSNTDLVTYQYLKDLVAKDYSDAEEIYDELYEWKVRFLAVNTNEYDTATNLSTVSKYRTWFYHFEVTGGPPGDEEIQLYYGISFPNGGFLGIDPFDIKFHNGGTPCVYAWYDNAAYGETGTCTAYIYDENENVLASASVEVTN